MIKSASKTKASNTNTGKSTPATKKSRKVTTTPDKKTSSSTIGDLEDTNGRRCDSYLPQTSTSVRGVTMRPSGKWQAQLYFAGQSRYIGVFESRERATLAYEIAREILKGGKCVSTTGEAAEKAVEAARKAAFEGASIISVCSPSPAIMPSAPLTPPTRTPSVKTPSTTASSVQSDGMRSTRAMMAAEILKAIGRSTSESPSEMYDSENQRNLDGSPRFSELPGSSQVRMLPLWVTDGKFYFGEALTVDEWESVDYRKRNGWNGLDLVHDISAPVRILQYFVKYGNGIGEMKSGGEGTTLTGIVHFTARAESHRGFCHGGSMTSVMDDIVGWVSFLVTGTCKPWTGFTVQVNTALRKPIPLDSYLLVMGTITKIEGRKVFVTGKIIDPDNDDAIHAEVEGMVVMNVGVLPIIGKAV